MTAGAWEALVVEAAVGPCLCWGYRHIFLLSWRRGDYNLWFAFDKHKKEKSALIGLRGGSRDKLKWRPNSLVTKQELKGQVRVFK